jgi:hypothetical protein
MQWPCEVNYHVPTTYEWKTAASIVTWNPTTWGSIEATIFQNTLKLPFAGYKDRASGSLSNVGSSGKFWSSSPDPVISYGMYFGYDVSLSPSAIYPTDSHVRSFGWSVRCLKN